MCSELAPRMKIEDGRSRAAVLDGRQPLTSRRASRTVVALVRSSSGPGDHGHGARDLPGRRLDPRGGDDDLVLGRGGTAWVFLVFSGGDWGGGRAATRAARR